MHFVKSCVYVTMHSDLIDFLYIGPTYFFEYRYFIILYLYQKIKFTANKLTAIAVKSATNAANNVCLSFLMPQDP